MIKLMIFNLTLICNQSPFIDAVSDSEKESSSWPAVFARLPAEDTNMLRNGCVLSGKNPIITVNS